MSRSDRETEQKNGYGDRLKEITAVLKKHSITRGISPEKLRLILEDLGQLISSWASLCLSDQISCQRDTVTN